MASEVRQRHKKGRFDHLCERTRLTLASGLLTGFKPAGDGKPEPPPSSRLMEMSSVFIHIPVLLLKSTRRFQSDACHVQSRMLFVPIVISLFSLTFPLRSKAAAPPVPGISGRGRGVRTGRTATLALARRLTAFSPANLTKHIKVSKEPFSLCSVGKRSERRATPRPGGPSFGSVQS